MKEEKNSLHSGVKEENNSLYDRTESEKNSPMKRPEGEQVLREQPSPENDTDEDWSSGFVTGEGASGGEPFRHI